MYTQNKRKYMITEYAVYHSHNFLVAGLSQSFRIYHLIQVVEEFFFSSFPFHFERNVALKLVPYTLTGP